MLIIYGFNTYGEVERCDDEYAITRFAHLFFVPIAPAQSLWIANGVATEILDHGPSIAATYARWWGSVAALLTIVLAVAVHPILLILLPGWAALVWQSLRRRHASPLQARRGEFHRAAFGVRCDPKYFTTAVRDELAARFEERWAAIGNGRSPNDVARLGARNGSEAVVAYALLRLAGLKLRGAAALEHAADADRIVNGEHEAVQLDGPFRGVSESVPDDVIYTHPSLAEAERAARVARVPQPVRGPNPGEAKATWWLATIAAVAATLGGATMLWSLVQPATPIELGDLIAGKRPDRATLRCDAIERGSWVRKDPSGKVVKEFALCTIGDHYLILGYQPGLEPTATVTGTFQVFNGTIDQDVAMTPEMLAVTFRQIFEVEDWTSHVAGIVACSLMLLAAPGLLIHRRIRARRRTV